MGGKEGGELFQEDVALFPVVRGLEGRMVEKSCAPSKMPTAKPESSGASRGDSASSSAARWLSDIFALSMMESEMGFAGLTEESNRESSFAKAMVDKWTPMNANFLGMLYPRNRSGRVPKCLPRGWRGRR